MDLIGADYCAERIECPDPIEAMMYNDPIVANRGEIDWRDVHLTSEQAKQ